MGFFPGGGGVIYDWSGNINVNNSVFNNNASTGIGSKSGGGALLLYQTKNAQILGSTFTENNAAQAGGAIYFAETANGSISGSHFTGNNANNYGGAIYYQNAKNISITDSDFTNNYVGDMTDPNTYGGAIAINGLTINDTSITNAIQNCIFEGNHAYGGGALYITNSVLSFDNLTFNKNNAVSGGAIEISPGGTLGQTNTISNSHFTENNASERGGAIYSSGSFTINNGEFTKNTASQGGALFIASDSPHLINSSTFKENSAETLGGAIDIMEGTLQINNSKFENNHSGTRGGAIAFSVTQNNTSDAYPTKSLLIYNTDFINNTSDQQSGGAIYVNVSTDPDIRGSKMVRIESNDGSTHEFTGNKHYDYNGKPEANAIFINQGVVDLRTNNEGSKLLFNDGISGQGPDYASVNVDGDVIFNSQIKNVALSLNNGNLTLNENSNEADLPILNNVDLSLNSGVFNIQNDKFDTLNIRNFSADSDGDIKIAFDADLSSGESDFFNVTQAMAGSLKFDAEHFDVKLKDGNKDKFQLFNRSDYNFSFIGDAIVQYTTEGKYTLTVGEDGFINVLKDTSNGLSDAVAADGIREYRQDIPSDLYLSDNLGAMNGEYLKINMDSQSLNGSGHSGITVSENQHLELNNIGDSLTDKSMNGFKTNENGAAVNNAGILTINNSVFKDNKAENNGGAIYNTGTVNITDSSFVNNNAGSEGGAIYNNGGNITITAANKNLEFFGNIDNSNELSEVSRSSSKFNDITMVNNGDNIAKLTFKGSKAININDGIKGEGIITKEETGAVNLGGDNSQFTGDIYLNNGAVNLMQNAQYFSAQNTHFNNDAMLNLANNNPTDKVNFGNLYMDGNGKLGFDIDMKSGLNDTIAAETVAGDGKLSIEKINILPDKNANFTNMKFNFIETDENGSSPLLDVVELNPNSASEVLGPIFKYGTNYNPATGQIILSGGPGSTSNNYNPAVLTGPVGAMVGAWLTQVNSYDMAFNNMDMYMFMPEEQRKAMKLRNKYASTMPGVYSPTMNVHEEKGAWFKPYSNIESVGLNHGPKVNNVAYGSFFGFDSDLYELKNGFDGIFSIYGGYNGSHQKYDGNSIYQNGGTLGATGIVYKGNFFSALTANAGASVGEANTMYGVDNFTTLMSGVASKTGYNWELGRGKFIIQPSYLMSYSFINTFKFTNAAGVTINSDPMNVLQISPGLKFIGNLKHGWQPYLGFSIIWNIMDETKFTANNVNLPEFSIDPYFMYGLGVQKSAGERCTGFFQTMFRSGGRNGVGFQFGFRMKT